MTEIKPGQHRALHTALGKKRCPKCNRMGQIVTSRKLQAACLSCGVMIRIEAEFELDSRWTAKIMKLEAVA